MESLIRKVNSGEILDGKEAYIFFEMMMEGKLSDVQIGSALIAMKLRGETEDELYAAAKVLNSKKIRFNHSYEKVVDTCGTGGDGKNCVNVSSAVAVILAALGYKVVKHGNVAISGRVGSANIFEINSIPVKFDRVEAEEYFIENGFVFLFAPLYHPAMKYVAPIRKELMVPTLFNLLGPLANPADPTHQMIGVGNKSKLDLYVRTAAKFEDKDFIIYCSKDGYDEISTGAITNCYEIRKGEVKKFIVNPEDFFEPFEMPTVLDEDDAKSKFITGIKGENEEVSKLFALNSAVALYLVDKIPLEDGFERALESILSGQVYEKFMSLKKVKV